MIPIFNSDFKAEFMARLHESGIEKQKVFNLTEKFVDMCEGYDATMVNLALELFALYLSEYVEIMKQKVD